MLKTLKTAQQLFIISFLLMFSTLVLADVQNSEAQKDEIKQSETKKAAPKKKKSYNNFIFHLDQGCAEEVGNNDYVDDLTKIRLIKECTDRKKASKKKTAGKAGKDTSEEEKPKKERKLRVVEDPEWSLD